MPRSRALGDLDPCPSQVLHPKGNRSQQSLVEQSENLALRMSQHEAGTNYVSASEPILAQVTRTRGFGHL